MKFILALLFLTSQFFVSGQISAPDTSLTCTANWKKGEKKTLLINHGKSKGNESPGNDFKLDYEAHVTVLDSTEDGYTIQWVFELPAFLKIVSPEMAKALIVYNGLKMLFTTTPEGVFKELINWEEVRKAYVDMALISIPGGDSLANSILEKTMALFNSKEIVESVLIKEIQLYHLPYGGYFSADGTKGTTELPNPFGGEPLPALTLQKLTAYDPLSGYKVIYAQEMDSAGTAAIMKGLFKKMDIPTDQADEEFQQVMATFKISDKSEFLVSIPSGWIKTINYERIAAAGEVKQTETYTFQLK